MVHRDGKKKKDRAAATSKAHKSGGGSADDKKLTEWSSCGEDGLLEQAAAGKLDLSQTDTRTGNTLLLYATRRRWIKLGRWLIDQKVHLDAANHQGVTALMMACARNVLDLASDLVDAGANSTVEDRRNCTALCYLLAAAETHGAPADERLLEHLWGKTFGDAYLQRRLEMVRNGETLHDTIVEKVVMAVLRYVAQKNPETLVRLGTFKHLAETINQNPNNVKLLGSALTAVTACCRAPKSSAFFDEGCADACLTILESHTPANLTACASAISALSLAWAEHVGSWWEGRTRLGDALRSLEGAELTEDTQTLLQRLKTDVETDRGPEMPQEATRRRRKRRARVVRLRVERRRAGELRAKHQEATQHTEEPEPVPPPVVDKSDVSKCPDVEEHSAKPDPLERLLAIASWCTEGERRNYPDFLECDMTCSIDPELHGRLLGLRAHLAGIVERRDIQLEERRSLRGMVVRIQDMATEQHPTCSEVVEKLSEIISDCEPRLDGEAFDAATTPTVPAGPVGSGRPYRPLLRT